MNPLLNPIANDEDFSPIHVTFSLQVYTHLLGRLIFVYIDSATQNNGAIVFASQNVHTELGSPSSPLLIQEWIQQPVIELASRNGHTTEVGSEFLTFAYVWLDIGSHSSTLDQIGQ